MGLLRHSLFIDLDGGKGKSSMPNGSQVASGKQNGAPQKQRQGPRLPPLNIPQDHQPATHRPKSKSLSSILRNWRRDSSAASAPPPPPPLPMPKPILAPSSASIKTTKTMLAAPSSPTSSVFSAATAPVQRFPGPGVCSTLPASRYPQLPPLSAPGRVYGGPHSAMSSSPNLSVPRTAPLSISPPIPGVGDVPAHYRYRGEAQGLPPLPDLHPHAMNSARHPMHRQLAYPTTNTSGVVFNPRGSLLAPSPRGLGQNPRAAPQTPAGRTISMGPGQTLSGNSPHASPSRLAVLRGSAESWLSTHAARLRQAPTLDRDSAFIADAEVAALLTEAHIPPESPVTSLSSRMSTPRISHTPTGSISSVGSFYGPSPIDPSGPIAMGGGKTGNGASLSRDSLIMSRDSVVVGAGGRPSSIFSNVSWASVGSARIKNKAVVRTRDSTVSPDRENDRSDQVEALVDSPARLTTAPAPLEAPAPVTPISSEPARPILPPGADMTSPSSTIPDSPSPSDGKTRPLSLRPKCVSAFTSRLDPSQWSASQPPLPPSPNAHGHDGMLTPTGTSTRSPSTNTLQMQHVRDRNTALELTNARLEAELTRVTSEQMLRSRNSYVSARGNTNSPGAPIDFSSSRSSYRSSQLTVRDERRDSRSSAVTRIASASNQDLSVPSLLAEIDALRRNGELLQKELFAVRSQVSLLFPPTPVELAEAEAREALEVLKAAPRTAGSRAAASGASPRSPGPKHPMRQSQSSISSVSLASSTMSSPLRVEGTDQRERDRFPESPFSTPSSSTSDTWPITPVLSEWNPAPIETLASPVGYAGSPHYDKYSYNYMAATATATATAQAQVPSQAPPALGSRIPRPVSSMPANSALPPRPPRAARREMALQLPPGAGPALPAPRATTFHFAA